MKEKINTKELFEKYRKDIKSGMLSGWGEFPEEGEGSFEEYMEDEGYGKGVVEFLINLSKITNLFILEARDFYKGNSETLEKDDYEDFPEHIVEEVYKRNDGKLFKIRYCEADGTYDKEFIEVVKKTRKKTYYE